MDNITASFTQEVKKGERFEFGKNWKNFSKHLNEEKIGEAEKSLLTFLGDIKGKTFIDIGSGSGLFSLAAKRLGAKVFSVDYDPSSFYCTQKLKDTFYPADEDWQVEQESVLDDEFINNTGKFDIVYSWGVLHHTGKMWQALNNAGKPVKDGGLLFISIYNYQPFFSRYWTAVKKIYNANFLGKILIFAVHIPYFFFRAVIAGIIKYKNPVGVFSYYKKQRGMSVWYDWIDWLGGYPFETATPEQICDFYIGKGYSLQKIRTTNSLGCNEFVFKKQKLNVS